MHTRHDSNERGIALVVTVLTLMVALILAATFMSTTVGEHNVTTNVHVARNALFAADAGVRVIQQVLANTATAKLDSLIAAWPGTGPVIADPATLFPAGAIVSAGTSPRYSGTATITFTDSTLTDSAQAYNFAYTITSAGGSGAYGARRIQSQGVLRVSASTGTFADYLMFTDIHTMPNGAAIWFSSSSSFDGRVHTNGEFRFAYAPYFHDDVSSVNAKAWYYNNGSPQELAADHNGSLDVPGFFGGFRRGATAVPPPPNPFSQQNAALGLPPTAVSPPNSTIRAQLGLGGSGPPPSGIYVVHSGSAVTGGLYVQGNLDLYKATVDSSGRQVFELRQASATTIVTIDRAAHQTIVTRNGVRTTYSGTPNELAYVDGAISDMRGPDRVANTPQPAIAPDNPWLVAASGDIVLQGDLVTDDFNSGAAVLGIISSNGSVRVGTAAPNDMYLDAFVMALGASGAFEVDDYNSGAPRGAFHLRGGVVARYCGAFYTFNGAGQLLTGFSRDFHYDRRGIVPPYYPTTNLFTADAPTTRTLVWKEI